MRKLLLIRHSAPTLDGTVPASRWHLSGEGRRLCAPLAAHLAPHRPSVVVASVEPKAAETARLVAGILGIPWETMDDLHEHERPLAGLAPSRDEFRAQVARLLRNPDDLVFGAETGAEARTRFASAIHALLEKHPTGNVAVVTHGTVMALFVGHVTGLDPVSFWQSLGLPAFAVLSLPDLGLLDVVAGVTQPPAPGASWHAAESAR